MRVVAVDSWLFEVPVNPFSVVLRITIQFPMELRILKNVGCGKGVTSQALTWIQSFGEYSRFSHCKRCWKASRSNKADQRTENVNPALRQLAADEALLTDRAVRL
jgi:hypothetical protein